MLGSESLILMILATSAPPLPPSLSFLEAVHRKIVTNGKTWSAA